MTRQLTEQRESLRETRKDPRGIVKRVFIETPWKIDILKKLITYESEKYEKIETA